MVYNNSEKTNDKCQIESKGNMHYLSMMVVVCALLFAAHLGGRVESTTGAAHASGASVPKWDRMDGESSGPTVRLNYSTGTFEENPISSFLYFIPLIALTRVDTQTSADNNQTVRVISYERKITANSFQVVCKFEIRGKGFHKSIFEPAGMITTHTAELKGNELLARTLDYIKFEGEGVGRIEVEGTIDNSMETVTEVKLQFNPRGGKSPVTIGLYDIKPKDGQYRYENRSNEMVARVNTLTFKKSKRLPRLGVRVASITKATKSHGLIARIKGTIANLLIKPPKIDRLGNETMLNFGYAILKQEPEFTFPKARNIKEDRRVVLVAPDVN